MLTYNEYLTKIRHSQPYVKVLIGGQDVTSRLVRGRGIETDSVLDTPELGVYTSYAVEIYLTNHDNYFSAKEIPNFFSENDLNPSGWRVPVVIQGGFYHSDLQARVLFYGEIEEVFKLPSVRHVRVLVLDLSTRLRLALVDNVGELVQRNLVGGTDNSDYTEVNPVYQIGAGDLPISRGSVSARIGRDSLRVHPALPQGGALGDYRDVSVDLNRGVFTFAGEPPDKADTTLFLEFKTAFRYRTPEFLIYALADAQGIFSDMTREEQLFARTLLESPVLEHSQNQVTSRGRPKKDVVPLIRGIYSDLDGAYLCGDRVLLEYKRRDDLDFDRPFDNYEVLGTCPDTDAVLLEVIKSGDTFYLLSSGSFTGFGSSKIWKFVGGVWTEIGTDASTSHPYDYDTQLDVVSDNRKSFVIHDGYLYYVYENTDTTTGSGVRRINLATDAVETVFTHGITGRYRIDFVIHNNLLYVFVCQFDPPAEPAVSDHFRIYSVGLSGGTPTELHHEEFPRSGDFRPAFPSDIVVFENHFYFVLSFHRRLKVVGKAELCRLPVAGGTRSVLREYENMLYAARSLTIYKNRVYWLEGQWLSSFGGKLYPTFTDAGHLQSCDRNGMIVDDGGVWRSYVDRDGGTGFGVHTAFPSNLWHDNLTDTLFFIAGYGLPIDVDADSIASVDTPIVKDLTNWVWLQFGRNLATRISFLETNGASTWNLMSEIARTVDWEIGFTDAFDELETFYATYPHLERFGPRQYLFFRPKVARDSGLVLDGSVNVEVGNALDSTLVYNHIVVPYGDGFWTEPDEVVNDARSYLIPTGLLSSDDGAWAELLGKIYYERQRVPRHKVSILLKYAPQLQLGQRLEVTSRWNSFESVPFQLTQVEHFSDMWQTRIEGREIIVEGEGLKFDEAVKNIEVILGTAISEVLPSASGGTSPITYRLEGLPEELTWTESTRTYAGQVLSAQTSVVKYTALDASTPPRSVSVSFKLVIRDVKADNFGMAVVGENVYLGDNGLDRLRAFSEDGIWNSSGDRNLPAGDFFDMTATPTHFVVLDKSGDSDRLRFYLSGGGEDGVPINLDKDRVTGEERGDWRGVAYNSVDGLLYVMNLYGVIRSYNSDRSQNVSESIDLDLCADWQAIDFSVDTDGVWLLTLVGDLPVVLGWDIFQNINSPVSRRDAKDVELKGGLIGWTGIAVSGDKLFVCQRMRGGFQTFKR